MSRLGSGWITGASGSRAENWILSSISTSNCKALDRNFTCFKLLWSSLQTCRLDKSMYYLPLFWKWHTRLREVNWLVCLSLRSKGNMWTDQGRESSNLSFFSVCHAFSRKRSPKSPKGNHAQNLLLGIPNLKLPLNSLSRISFSFHS